MEELDIHEHQKQIVAQRAVDGIESGMVVGLGTGSTVHFALFEIGSRLADGRLKNIIGIPTSADTIRQANNLKIPLTTLEDHPDIDLTIDGADEIDPQLNLIKGGGGALLREKIVAQASHSNIIIADESIESRFSGKDRPIILVVEDNRDMRVYIRDFLTDNYHIKEARNGREGIEIAQKKMPDLVISDVMMPGMDGFELCKNLKTDPRTSHIPVILLTARAAETDKLSGLETGADDYIIKPFNAIEVKVRAKNLIEQRRKLQEKFSQKINVEPEEITVTSIDHQWLKKTIAFVEENIENPELRAGFLADHIGFSRMQLHRKLKALTGLTTTAFVRTIRLKRAAQLLSQKSARSTEIAYKVGFQNPSHFAACFKKQFGVSSSEYGSRE